ncbi:NACHT domain-containing NTPase [Leptolyngbya sp. FACHB-261]|uniref:NACHT domain-containing protein n=1 Tax=Leptolyngbya sp. FACHB-261 TaxID=2692806 RepID=UPI001689A960|nr:NACHT domain-containing protein [Leptolyngbya sp. FACHB-261]MBD2102443.1 NACHT domain-containing protein [Leptolyngbya sp. FACHB-261]
MTGELIWIPMAVSAVSGVAGPILQALQAAKEKGSANKQAANEAFQRARDASKHYVQNYVNRHGTLKVLGMNESMMLESVYTGVQFLKEWNLGRSESLRRLEERHRQKGRRGFQLDDTGKQQGVSVANQTQYLMVLGGPGAGKSTFLKKMGLEALKGSQKEFKHSCIPVFIELKNLRFSNLTVQQAITKELEIFGYPDTFATVALEQGKLLLLLDGLDEVPSNQIESVATQIQNLVDQYSKNRFIASCRIAAYQNQSCFHRFVGVEMADFDDEQIKAFIDNWFSSRPNLAQDCWEKLNSGEHEAAKELTQTPLLLTLVCLLYQRTNRFPDLRATLYERALWVLLDEWAGNKGIPQEDLYKGLDTRRKQMLLAEVAHDAFQNDYLFLPRQTIAEQIEEFLGEIIPNEKPINGEAVLKSIEVQHGILVERAEGVYSFSHLTLQEFLTARYVVRDSQKIEQLVADHLTDERWREVFLLLPGLMEQGPDELLLQMEQAAQKLINTPKLRALLHWATQVTDSLERGSKPAAKRVSAIFFSLSLARALSFSLNHNIALNHDIVLAHALSLSLDLDLDCALALNHALSFDHALSLSLDRALALDRTKIFKSVDFTVLATQLETLKDEIPSNDQPLEIRRAFAERPRKTWFDTLSLDPEWISLSEAEIEALNNCFYINHLLIKCQQEALRPPKNWAAIEDRMLKLEEEDLTPRPPSLAGKGEA